LKEIVIKQLDVGSNTPTVRRLISIQDANNGLRISFEVTYPGTVCVVVEGRINFEKTRAPVAAGVHVEERSVNLLSCIQHLSCVWILAVTWLTAKVMFMKLDTDVKTGGMTDKRYWISFKKNSCALLQLGFQ
jgi:hypothetical protein